MTTENTEIKAKKPRAPRKPRATKQAIPQDNFVNWNELSKEVEELHIYSEYIIDAQTNKKIKYHKKFSEKLIGRLLEEAHKHLHERTEEQPFPANDLELRLYVNFLIVKYFTNLKDDFDNKTLSENLEMMDLITDSGLMRFIFDHVLDQEEIYKVYDRLDEYEQIAIHVDKLQTQLEKQIAKEIKNKEVLDKFKFKN